MNLLQPFIAETTAPDSRIAIIAGNGDRASYADIKERSSRLASAWRKRGISSGDRVLLAMPLGIPLYVSIIALWRLGAVIVFSEPALGLSGLRHAIAAACPKALLSQGWISAVRHCMPVLWPMLQISPDDGDAGPEALEPVDDDHPALISFTSGSTGGPKMIIRGHGLLAHQNSCVSELLRSDREEVDLVAFPMFVLANLALGVTSVLPNWNLRRHDMANPKCVGEHIGKHGVTRALIPPSNCKKLVQYPGVSLRTIFTGGGPVFPDLLKQLTASAAEIVTIYGSTEAEPIAHQRVRDITDSDWEKMRTGGGLLAGRPIPEIRLRIMNHEIVVTGPHVSKGYCNAADDAGTKTRLGNEIWHRTGDAGTLDADGRLWLLGRMDGCAAGRFPFAIEAAARFWPGVSNAALISIDGESVLAIEGHRASRGLWQEQAKQICDARVVAIERMPLDRRHRSKIDYPALRGLLRAA